jgi:hypothetical protein
VIEAVQFEPAHVRAMKNFDAQGSLLENVSDAALESLKGMGTCWTFMHKGEVLCCAGFIRANNWRAQAWVLFQKTEPRLFLPLHWAIAEKIVEGGFVRVEAYTNPMHVNAERWMRTLGFEIMVPYRPLFFPDGSGASEWSLDVEKLAAAVKKRKRA